MLGEYALPSRKKTTIALLSPLGICRGRASLLSHRNVPTWSTKSAVLSLGLSASPTEGLKFVPHTQGPFESLFADASVPMRPSTGSPAAIGLLLLSWLEL